MTAEIGILNSSAVALAADSAVTVTNRKGQKIFNSANKLFRLSKYHPIGIMIYGNAEFCGLPWETIIKFYRRKLAEKSFLTLKNYADDFIQFINDNDSLLFTEELKKDNIFKLILSLFEDIFEKIDKKMDLIFEDEDDIDPDDIIDEFDKLVALEVSEILTFPLLSHFDEEDVKRVQEEYRITIDDIIEKVFEDFPLTDASLENFRIIAANYLCRDCFGDSTSGVVIAGYGENEFFPSILSYNFEGNINGKIKYKFDESKTAIVSHNNPGGIIPFAQDDMVYSIMCGIDPYSERFSKELLSELISDYPEILLKEIINVFDLKEDDQRNELIGELIKKHSREILKTYFDETKKYRQLRHINPIVLSIHMMPKEELAVIAETLVNLTSFKRKISADAETVGGPIDVALITKGDGFIWIKRKHYFSADLNPHFFQNYLRSE